VTQVVSHILNALAGLRQVHGDGVAQAMDGAPLNACYLGITRK
jgi:hypothetical protein